MTCAVPRVALNVGSAAASETTLTACMPPVSSRYVDYFRSTTPEPEVCTTCVTWRCRTAGNSRLTGPGPTTTWPTSFSCLSFPLLMMMMTSLVMASFGRQLLAGSGTSTVAGRPNFRRCIRLGDVMRSDGATQSRSVSRVKSVTWSGLETSIWHRWFRGQGQGQNHQVTESKDGLSDNLSAPNNNCGFG